MLSCAQTGQMRLTPNNPNSVASVVQYGYTADNLNFTSTGYAEACPRRFCLHGVCKACHGSGG